MSKASKTFSRTTMLALLITGAVFSHASAATFVVSTTADTQDASAGNGVCADSNGACSLRAAITEANALTGADIITLPAGTYTTTLPVTGEDVNAGGDFDITSPMTINGADAGTTIIQANALPDTATERVIHCVTAATAVAINDVTIRHGNSPATTSGGGIRLETATTNLTLNRVVVTSNRSAGSGGGISMVTSGMVLNVNDSTVSNNRAGSSVAGSTGNGAGIGVFANVTVNITNTIVTGNANNSSVSNAIGGGLSISTAAAVGATVTITGSTISNNSSTSTLEGGAGIAGGIYNLQANLNIVNSRVSGNTSSFHTGVRTFSSTGGAANTTITNSTISNNTATVAGGGVTNAALSSLAATTTITGSTISDNIATDVMTSEGVSGGIENFSSQGGLATVNATNSTISGNDADFGGGIGCDGAGATINLSYSTLASNTATTAGGGVHVTGDGVINLKNSIVADNSSATGPDILGTITSQNYNHVENIADGTFVALANDVVGSDPVLGLLANNGGPTLTHLPGRTSPVLNTIAGGTSECGTTVATDQRGFTRPVGAGCEKGSVEVQVIQLTGALSRKIHGDSGTFDIHLPLTGPAFGVECRSGGGSGNYTLVFNFNNPVASGSASVTTGTGTVVGSPIFAGNSMTVNLTGVNNVQRLTLTLSGVTDSFGQVLQATAVSMNVLIGDTTGNLNVNATDIGQTKAQSGQAVAGSNFRSDVNVNGAITASDISQVKALSGTFIPLLSLTSSR
jgi:CSLREA domain-containing protein